MCIVEEESGIILSPTRILMCLVVLIRGLITNNLAFLFNMTVWRRKKKQVAFCLFAYIYFVASL